MEARSIVLGLLATLASMAATAGAQDRPADEISKLLFDTYIARPGKIETSTLMAAEHIIAQRGRESGFWKKVLAELQTDDEYSEVGCVRILGNMLARDAGARDGIRRERETGEFPSARPLSVHLGPEVVAELLERGQKAGRFRIDHYAIALARARVPEARDFFTSMLRAKTGPTKADVEKGEAGPEGYYHLDSTRFHAAVGLAQLGDPAGIEWLIAHCEDIQGHVSGAKPLGASPGGSLGSCCLAALRQLSGEKEPTSKAEWEAWWKTADTKRLKFGAVRLVDFGGAF